MSLSLVNAKHIEPKLSTLLCRDQARVYDLPRNRCLFPLFSSPVQPMGASPVKGLLYNTYRVTGCSWLWRSTASDLPSTTLGWRPVISPKSDIPSLLGLYFLLKEKGWKKLFSQCQGNECVDLIIGIFKLSFLEINVRMEKSFVYWEKLFSENDSLSFPSRYLPA